MNRKKLKLALVSGLLLLITVSASLGIHAYRGTYLGSEDSPNKKYSIRYYSSFNPFRMFWSMPGGSACEPRWVRLYDNAETKLQEVYTTSCALEMEVNWLGKQVILPDGKTIWQLSNSSNQ